MNDKRLFVQHFTIIVLRLVAVGAGNPAGVLKIHANWWSYMASYICDNSKYVASYQSLTTFLSI